MASTTIGTLRVVLETITRGFQQGMEEAGGVVKRFKKDTEDSNRELNQLGEAGVRTGRLLAGALTIGAIAKLTGDFIEMSGALVDLEAKTGISIRGLQRLKLATQESGVELNQIAGVALQLQKRLGEGKDSFVGALEKVGLNFSEIRRMSPEDALFAVGDAIGRITDQNEKVAETNEIFGKMGTTILPALNGKMKETADAYEKMGLVMSDQVIKAGDELGDQWTVLKSLGAALLAQVIGPLLPGLSALVGGFTKLVTAGAPVAKFLLDLSGRPMVNAIKSVFDLADAFNTLRLKAEQLPDVKNAIDRNITQEVAKSLAAFKAAHMSGGLKPLSEDEMKEVDRLLTESAKKSIELSKKVAEDKTKAARAFYNFIAEREIEDVQREQELAERKKEIIRDYYNFVDERRMEDDARAEESRRQQEFDASAKTGTPWESGVLHPPVEQVRSGGRVVGGGMLEGIRDVLKTQLGPTIMAAVAGGGSVWQSIGSLIGQSLTGGLTKTLTKAFPAFMNSFFGQIVGAVLPGIGALLGPLFSKLFGGVSKEVKEARSSLEEFQRTLRSTLTDTQKAEAGTEGWRQDVVRVRDAYLATGRTADDALAIVRQLWDTDHPDRMRAAMDEINRVLEEEKRLADDAEEAIRRQEQAFEDAKEEAGELVGKIEGLAEKADGLPASIQPYIDKLLELGLITQEQADKLHGLRREGEVDWKAMQAAAEKFGINLQALGGKFDGAKLGATAQDIINTFGLLTRGGTSIGTVLQGMADEISALVRDSKQFGTTIPANMRPWIQNLFDTGQLLDAQGNKIEDISDIKWGEEMKDEAMIAREGFAGIIAKLDELIAKITGPLTQALDDITRDRTIDINARIQPVPIPRDLVDRNVPFESFGTGGLVTRPTLAMIGESGPELVMPINRMQSALGGKVGSPFPGLPAFDIPIPRVPLGSDVYDRTAPGDGSRGSGADRNQIVLVAMPVAKEPDLDKVLDHVERNIVGDIALDRHRMRLGLMELFDLVGGT